LTIADVAEFDARGLWVPSTARFSNHGNLKQTINYFVDDSPRGMTQEELATLLGVRTHNTLWALVRKKRIRRQRLGPTFVYLSRRPSIRREQVGRRESVLAELQKPRPTSRQVIATLLELIKDPQSLREQLVFRCQRSGVSMSRDELDAICERYDLDKKIWGSVAVCERLYGPSHKHCNIAIDSTKI